MSSSNRELALAYLEDAEYAFEEAMRAYKRRLFYGDEIRGIPAKSSSMRRMPQML